MTPVPCQSCVLTVQQPDGVENKTNRRQLRGKHCGGWGEAKLIRFGSATSSLAYMHANALLLRRPFPLACAHVCVCVKPRERTSVGCEHFQPSSFLLDWTCSRPRRHCCRGPSSLLGACTKSQTRMMGVRYMLLCLFI